MKALYTIAYDKLYRVDQDFRIPRNVVRYMENNLTMDVDTHTKNANVNIWLNSFNKKHAKTNEDLVEIIKDKIRDKKITQIDPLQNFYKMTIEYSLFSKDGEEIEHSISVYPLKAVDAIVPLGVTKRNELPFRVVKTFNKTVDFRFRDGLPFGIMNEKGFEYVFKVHDIRIVQDTNKIDERHPSFEERPFVYGSHTIRSFLEHTILVYSSRAKGVDFASFEIPFIPRIMHLNMEILLDNFVVTYNSNEFDRLLIENINIKNNTTDVDDIFEPTREDDHHHHHNHPHHRCRHGIFVISEPQRRGSLLVVEDLYPDSEFDYDTMIRKHRVIHDCPSVEVGDYVVFVPDRHYDDPIELFDDDHPEERPIRYESEECHCYGKRKERVKPPWLQE